MVELSKRAGRNDSLGEVFTEASKVVPIVDIGNISAKKLG